MAKQRPKKPLFKQIAFVMRYITAHYKGELVPVQRATTRIHTMLQQLDDIEAQLPKQRTK